MSKASKDREKAPRRAPARPRLRPAPPPEPPRLRLFGGFDLRTADAEPIPVSARKSAALLAYLALHPGEAIARDKLATLLWEDRAQAQARGSLRQALTLLRKVLPGDGLAAETESVTLRPDALAVDAIEYRAALDGGDVAGLERAVELYRGDLLDGFHAGAALFEDWLLAERETMRQRALEALARLLELQRAAGDRQRAIRTAVRLLSLDPLQEHVHRALMQLHAEAGQRGAALRQFGICRDVLKQELGVGVEPATEALHAAIRSGDVATAETVPAAVAADDSDQPSLVAELRQLTALSASLALPAATRSPEGEHRAARRLRAAVEACAARFGGTVLGALGGTVTAVFGVPRARSRDTELAVRAALALRDELGQAVRIGIASGQVMVEHGQADEPPRPAGAALSDAAALQSAAAAGEVLVSSAASRTLAGRLHGERIDARGSVAWRAQSLSDARGALAFVGRRVERRLLESALAVCAEEGRGHAFLVRGEAGVGKTRLVDELARAAGARGIAVRRGHILDFGVGSDHDAIGALVCGLLGLNARASVAERTAAVEAVVRGGACDAAQRPFLHELLALPQPEDLRALCEAMGDRGRARGRAAALRALVRSATAQAPHLLVVEDVHWADAATLAAIDALLEAMAESRAVLVLTARPGEEPPEAPWRAARLRVPFSALELTPLRDDESRAVAAQFPDLDAGLAEECVQRAGGNALFLEQLLRGAAEGETSVPDSVRSIVLARVEALQALDRRALQAASVIGQRCELDALRHLLERDDYTADALLDQGLLDGDDVDVHFAHALIREAVYGALLEADRATLHQRAAGWFAERDPGLHAEQLDRAGDASAAAAYLRAAEHEAAQYRYPRALRFAERGETLAGDDALRHALLCVQGDRWLDLGRPAAALALFERARGLGGDEAARCRALLGLAACLRVLERHRDAQAVLADAQALVDAAGLEIERAHIHYLRGCIAFPLGDLEGCHREHHAALAIARRLRSPLTEARALSGLGDAAYARGYMRSAHTHFDRCITLAQRHGFGRVEVANLPMRGLTLLYLGDAAAALQAVDEALARIRLVGDPRAEMVTRSCVAGVLVWTADWTRLRFAAAPCAKLARELGAVSFEVEGLSYEGLAATHLDRRAEGRALLDTARRLGFPASAAYIGPTVLGFIAVVTSDADERRSAIAEAEALLAAGSVSHNHLSFHPLAMDAWLTAGEPERVEAHAVALERYTAGEPLPWTGFFAAWGRALAAAAIGNADRAELERLHAEATRGSLGFALQRLNAALG